MLNVKFVTTEHILDPSRTDAISDCEVAFAITKIPDTQINRDLIKSIDFGEYVDERAFIDRFGFKRYLSDLSTGCKTALVIANNPTKTVLLIETGNNARDAIFKYVREGNVECDFNGIDIKFDNYDDPIEVQVDGADKPFYKIGDLATWIIMNL